MGQLVFLRRTREEAQIFGGEVYFDIDGRNAGRLTWENQTVEVSPGPHRIKMYKSHTYDTFIGVAETTVEVGEGETLMVRYGAPMMVNQPGNLVISPYDSQEAERVIRARQDTIRHEQVAQVQRQQEQQRQYGNALKWVILFAVAVGVLIALSQIPLWLSF